MYTLKFQLSRLIFIFINCYQLSLAVDSCWQLMTADMKKKLTGIFMYTLKLILVPNYSFLCRFSFWSTIISCWQLMTADMKKKSPGIIMHTLKLILVLNFNSLAWFSFSSAVNSCHQLLTADDSWYEKKFHWNLYVHNKVDTLAKFQLSRLIFIFINCYQLSSAVDGCWQLMTA